MIFAANSCVFKFLMLLTSCARPNPSPINPSFKPDHEFCKLLEIYPKFFGWSLLHFGINVNTHLLNSPMEAPINPAPVSQYPGP